MKLLAPFKHLHARTIYTLTTLLAANQGTYTQSSVHYLFSHGLAASEQQAARYTAANKGGSWVHGKGPIIITPPYKAFNYTDAHARFWDTNLAQEEDLVTLRNAYDSLLKEEKNVENVVIVGVSRGASIALSLLAQAPAHIRAAVLESPFDAVDAMLSNHITKIFRKPHERLVGALHKRVIPKIFRHYRTDGPAPVDAIESIPLDLPILIVCSRRDGIVPAESSIAIYKRLRATDHHNAHLLILEKGRHCHIKRNSPGGILYRNVAHAFYQAYRLHHHPDWAAAGHEAFLKTQPNAVER